MHIVSIVIALVVAFILFKVVKFSIKWFINGVVGVVLLWAFNFFGAAIGINISINIITALIAGIFGIPGVIVMAIFQYFVK
ncbi:MAG: pro-sigmaK processing inhibitor BofA family protein [Sarcina sp.]